MNTEILFYIAMLVFALMITGLFLTLREFLEITDEPSQRKGVDPDGTGGRDKEREPQGRLTD